MRVLVLGGCGVMGSSVVRDLIKGEHVEKVIIADKKVDMTKVHETVRTSKKVSTVTIDISDSQALVEVIKENDVVINCVGPYFRFGIHTMKAAIEANRNYIDICDDYDVTLAAFELDEAAKKAGISMIVGLGTSPGLSNIVAKYAADKMDQVDEIKILWGCGLADLPTLSLWSHMLHAMQGDVPQFINGQFLNVPGGSGEEEVEFLEPYGKCTVYYLGHPEPITLPRYIKGVKTVVNKGFILPLWANQLFKELIQHGFADSKPIMVGAQPVIPFTFMVEFMQNSLIFREQVEGYDAGPINIVVKGQKAGKNTTCVYPMKGRMAPGTGISASIGAQMLGSREVEAKGVLAPEGAIDPERFFSEFAKRKLVLVEKEMVTGILKT